MEKNKELIDYLIHKNIEKILGFSMKRTSNRTDAEDLTQDIVMEVYNSISNFKEYKGPQALEGWLWTIAHHTYCRWLNSKNKNNVVYIEGTISPNYFDVNDKSIIDDIIKNDELNLLRREISLLSKNYRDILIHFYIEDKTCAEISKIENLPLTTVKWRLHEAKNIIKERMENMKIYTEKSYDPGNLWVQSSGTFNVTYSSFYIYNQLKSLLRQNILLSAYRKPLTIEEISIDLNVPRVYIEEDINCLLEEQLMKKISLEKYQTNFVIITKDIKDELLKVIIETSNIIAENVLNILNPLEDTIRNVGFIGCHKPWDELLFSLIPFYCNFCYDNSIKNISNTLRPHGNSWNLLGFEGKQTDYPWNCSINSNVNLKGKFIQTIFITNILTSRAGQLSSEEAKFYYNFIKNNLTIDKMDSNNKEIAAELIDKGFLRKEMGDIKSQLICVSQNQYQDLTNIFNNSITQYNCSIFKNTFNKITDELKRITPTSFKNEIQITNQILSQNIIGYIVKYFLDKNILTMPKYLNTSVAGMYALYKD